MLSRSQAAADALEAHLRQIVNIPSGLAYEDQVTGDDRSVPDLAGTASDGSTPLLIEGKFDAGMTGHQPISYLKRLPGAAPGMLLFVVPTRRLELVWKQACDRAAADGFSFADASGGEDLRHTRCGQRVLAVTTWRALLKVLTAGAAAGDDLAAVSNLGQLGALCNQMDSEAFFPLTEEELGGSIPLRLRHYNDLIDRVVDKLCADGIATSSTTAFPGLNVRNDGRGHWGRFLGLRDVTCLLRLSITHWGKDRDTPLWLQIGWQGQPNGGQVFAALEPLRRQHRAFMRRDPKFVDVPIDLPTGEEAGVVVEAIVRQVQHVAQLLVPLEGPGTASPNDSGFPSDADDLRPVNGEGELGKAP